MFLNYLILLRLFENIKIKASDILSFMHNFLNCFLNLSKENKNGFFFDKMSKDEDVSSGVLQFCSWIEGLTTNGIQYGKINHLAVRSAYPLKS